MEIPIPPWHGAHPLIVHFPIALLFTAALFLFLSLILVRWRAAFATSFLILLLLGLAGIFLAEESGESAEDRLQVSESIEDAIEEHEEAAEVVFNFYLILTVAYLMLQFGLVLPGLNKLKPYKGGLLWVYFIAYLFACSFLAQTAHLGGLLVHKHGLKAELEG